MKLALYATSAARPVADARRRAAACAKAAGLTLVSGRAVPDAVLVLGGDGAMLAAAHRYPGVPLVGVNFGTLGFLAAAGRDAVENAVRDVAAGNCRVSERMMLRALGGDALNDVVVSKGVSGHVARLTLRADGHAAASFVCDGIVVATPTGSTAYSLSAGGPILLPDCGCISVTPICPHALASRPLVFRDTVRLTLSAEPRDGALSVFNDGTRVGTLGAGECLEIVRSPVVTRLVTLGREDPRVVFGRKLADLGGGAR